MPDEAGVAPRERRGLDPGVIQFIYNLLEDQQAAHRREHGMADEAVQTAFRDLTDRLATLQSSIREHYDTILTEKDSRYTERFVASQKAVEAAARSVQDALEAALNATKEAVNKSEMAVLKQADATFVKIDQLQIAMSKVVPREESDRAWAEMDRRLADHDSRLTTVEASKSGKYEMLPPIAVVLSFIAIVVAIVGAIATSRGGP